MLQTLHMRRSEYSIPHYITSVMIHILVYSNMILQIPTFISKLKWQELRIWFFIQIVRVVFMAWLLWKNKTANILECCWFFHFIEFSVCNSVKFINYKLTSFKVSKLFSYNCWSYTFLFCMNISVNCHAISLCNVRSSVDILSEFLDYNCRLYSRFLLNLRDLFTELVLFVKKCSKANNLGQQLYYNLSLSKSV